MMEVQFTFPVDQELRDRFKAATDRDHRPASQVLEELMRGYVDRDPASVAAAGTIDAVERQRRQDAADFALANIALEGFRPSAEHEASTRRFVDGEIELSEYLKSA